MRWRGCAAHGLRCQKMSTEQNSGNRRLWGREARPCVHVFDGTAICLFTWSSPGKGGIYWGKGQGPAKGIGMLSAGGEKSLKQQEEILGLGWYTRCQALTRQETSVGKQGRWGHVWTMGRLLEGVGVISWWAKPFTLCQYTTAGPRLWWEALRGMVIKKSN